MFPIQPINVFTKNGAKLEITVSQPFEGGKFSSDVVPYSPAQDTRSTHPVHIGHEFAIAEDAYRFAIHWCAKWVQASKDTVTGVVSQGEELVKEPVLKIEVGNVGWTAPIAIR